MLGGVDGGHAAAIQPTYHLFGMLEVGIKADRRKRGFQRIRQYGRTVEAAAFELAFAQIQVVTQLQFVGDFRQRVLVNQIGTQTRQFTLA